jgi:hypothetical protein
MLPDDTRLKIENIVAGNVVKGETDHCSAIRNFLCGSFATSTTVKEDFDGNAVLKKKQERIIEAYCEENKLWAADLPREERYLTRGGEAKVYIQADNLHVIKLNDAIYYATWLEFLNSVLLHNLLFADTSYDLLGFVKQEGILYAVLKQPFVVSDDQVDLTDIKKFLEFNGFENTKRNDYAHRALGQILEDMHDENVLVHSETLFFIDSVFYTISPALP